MVSFRNCLSRFDVFPKLVQEKTNLGRRLSQLLVLTLIVIFGFLLNDVINPVFYLSSLDVNLDSSELFELDNLGVRVYTSQETPIGSGVWLEANLFNTSIFNVSAFEGTAKNGVVELRSKLGFVNCTVGHGLAAWCVEGSVTMQGLWVDSLFRYGSVVISQCSQQFSANCASTKEITALFETQAVRAELWFKQALLDEQNKPTTQWRNVFVSLMPETFQAQDVLFIPFERLQKSSWAAFASDRLPTTLHFAGSQSRTELVASRGNWVKFSTLLSPVGTKRIETLVPSATLASALRDLGAMFSVLMVVGKLLFALSERLRCGALGAVGAN